MEGGIERREGGRDGGRDREEGWREGRDGGDMVHTCS